MSSKAIFKSDCRLSLLIWTLILTGSPSSILLIALLISDRILSLSILSLMSMPSVELALFTASRISEIIFSLLISISNSTVVFEASIPVLMFVSSASFICLAAETNCSPMESNASLYCPPVKSVTDNVCATSSLAFFIKSKA